MSSQSPFLNATGCAWMSVPLNTTCMVSFIILGTEHRISLNRLRKWNISKSALYKHSFLQFFLALSQIYFPVGFFKGDKENAGEWKECCSFFNRKILYLGGNQNLHLSPYTFMPSSGDHILIYYCKWFLTVLIHLFRLFMNRTFLFSQNIPPAKIVIFFPPQNSLLLHFGKGERKWTAKIL